MPTHICDITTHVDAHSVLHRLHNIGQELSEYTDLDIPFHGASTQIGDLFATRILPSGMRISGKITQKSSRLLRASILVATLDTRDHLVELVGPLLKAYLTAHPEPTFILEQEYKTEQGDSINP
jgi:hypothetical protein